MEKRLFIRKEHNAPITLKMDSSNEGEEKGEGSGKTLNISYGGACIVTDRLPEPSSVVSFELLYNGIGIPLPGFAEVRWVKPDKGGSGCRAGIQFLK